MTVDTTGGSGLANPDDFGNIGLEDVGAADVVIPRLQIVHREGQFKNNLSGQTYGSLKVIMLGMVKQRIMWRDEVETGDRPLCKSANYEQGFPNLDENLAKDKQFPVGKSNFDLANYPANKGVNGLVTLPCASCIFSQWDKQGRDGTTWKQPPCSEQHTYPILMSEDDWESWSPALVTFQRTGIKPSKSYLSGFAQTKSPMFTVFTEMSLEVNRRGSVEYSVPKFRKLEGTDRNMWREYGQTYIAIREFARTPPRNAQDDGVQGEASQAPVTSDNTNTGPSQPSPPPETVAATPQQAPVTQTAPPAATPPPAAPPAAAAAPPPAAPAPAPAGPASPAAPADDDDEMPF